MILTKKFDTQTNTKTYKFFGSSIFTSEVRCPHMYVERRFDLLIESHSNFCLNFCALLGGFKLAVACLELQL